MMPRKNLTTIKFLRTGHEELEEAETELEGGYSAIVYTTPRPYTNQTYLTEATLRVTTPKTKTESKSRLDQDDLLIFKSRKMREKYDTSEHGPAETAATALSQISEFLGRMTGALKETLAKTAP